VKASIPIAAAGSLCTAAGAAASSPAATIGTDGHGGGVGGAAGQRRQDLDLDLARRHAAGDRGAFDEIYAGYAPMVYSLALRLSGQAEEAADLTQEVFLRVHRHLGSFGGRSTLKTWIYRVALNHCRERLERHRPITLPIGEETDEAGAVRLADPGRGPEELAVAADLGRLVTRALALLPLAFREAVVLRDLEGLAYEEIAAVTGVHLGTVRSRNARGREQLRAVLERQEKHQEAAAAWFRVAGFRS
jgi:RNA polymerase sigma-70 factor (ECF subfamily)